eukprot:4111087-Karenia_brevis.AAC.1
MVASGGKAAKPHTRQQAVPRSSTLLYNQCQSFLDFLYKQCQGLQHSSTTSAKVSSTSSTSSAKGPEHFLYNQCQ